MAKKRAMTQREKDNAWLKEKLFEILGMIGFVFGVIGAGYMFFTGESLGWIIAGFIGGFILPIAPFAIIAGLFESHSDPLLDAANNRINREVAYREWQIKNT